MRHDGFVVNQQPLKNTYGSIYAIAVSTGVSFEDNTSSVPSYSISIATVIE